MITFFFSQTQTREIKRTHFQKFVVLMAAFLFVIRDCVVVFFLLFLKHPKKKKRRSYFVQVPTVGWFVGSKMIKHSKKLYFRQKQNEVS